MNDEPKSALLATFFVLLVVLTGCSEQQKTVAHDSTKPLAADPDNQIVNQSGQALPSTQPADGSDEVATNNRDATNQELPTLNDVVQNPRDPDEQDPYGGEPDEVEEVQTIDIPHSWKRLGDEHEIWVDFKNKEVIAAGNICMRAGPLEVFACPRRTKEHESVVSVNALSSQIHAALLAIGSEPGHPVKWHDSYEPATGPVIKITLMWKTADGISKRSAQEMVRNVKTNQIMKHDWVFGGSQTFTDEETGETFYYGDSGELVCLSNFSSATLDLPVQSSDANEGLLFEANTENIPEIGTKVYVVFKSIVE